MTSTRLFIDGCNVFIRSINYNTTPREWFIQQREHIDKFVNAAKKANYELIIYFDTLPAGTKIVTEENLYRDLRSSHKKLPGFFLFVIEYLTLTLGLRVLTNTSYELDDVLASHASHAKGILISKDRDYFLYKNRQYKICNNWYINKHTGELTLKGLIPDPLYVSNDMRSWRHIGPIEPYYKLPLTAAPKMKVKQNQWVPKTLLKFNKSLMKQFQIGPEPLSHDGLFAKRGVSRSLMNNGSMYKNLIPFTRYILHHNGELCKNVVDHEFYDFNHKTRKLELTSVKLSSDEIDNSEIYSILDTIMTHILASSRNESHKIACDHSDWICSLLISNWSEVDVHTKLTVHSYILSGLYHLCWNRQVNISFIKSILWISDMI